MNLRLLEDSYQCNKILHKVGIGPHFSNKSDFECLSCTNFRKEIIAVEITLHIRRGVWYFWQVSRWAGRAGSSKLSSNLAKKTIQQTPRFPVAQMQWQLV